MRFWMSHCQSEKNREEKVFKHSERSSLHSRAQKVLLQSWSYLGSERQPNFDVEKTLLSCLCTRANLRGFEVDRLVSRTAGVDGDVELSRVEGSVIFSGGDVGVLLGLRPANMDGALGQSIRLWTRAESN